MNLHPGVEAFLLNGAKLMWPGIQLIDDCKKDEVLQVIDANGELLAIGAMLTDSVPINGPALEILTIKGDILSLMSKENALELE